MTRWRGTIVRVSVTAGCLAALLARPAIADEIRAGGDTLHGTVKGVTASSVEFAPEYGSGTISIPVEKIESIKADGEFYFVHGPDGTGTRGRLQSVRDGQYFVGDSEESAVAIECASVHEVYDASAMDGGMGWIRRNTALWHGSFDLGFDVTESTTDTLSFSTGFTADRKKAPSRLTFTADYRYGTKTEKEEDDGNPDTDEGTKKTRDEDEVKGMARGEYDVMPRLFVFASQDGEYDGIESLSLRAVPKAGMGYRLWESKAGLLQLEAGGAYNYEKYFGGEDDGYFAVAFGKLFEWKLPWLGAEFMWRTDYLPSVDDFTGDYLIRSDAELLIPMIRWLKLKIGVEDTYDSTPADDADKNAFVSTVGLAATY